MDPIEALRIRGIGGGKKPTGNALPADVRTGKTYSSTQGYDLSGTMPVRSTVAQTVTPTTLNIVKTAGIYDGDITIQGDANLVASNIVSGKNIFGVAGSAKRSANGSFVASGTSGTVPGLAFNPKTVLINHLTSGPDPAAMSSDSALANAVSLGAPVITLNAGGFSVTGLTYSGGSYQYLAFE